MGTGSRITPPAEISGPVMGSTETKVKSVSGPRFDSGLVHHKQLMARVVKLLLDVGFLNYKWNVREGHGGVFIQGSYPEADIYTKEIETQLTRKWLISPLMTDSEIISTVFKAALTSMEHKTREGFLYKGARIFGPHFDVEDLVVLCKDRENAGGRK